jgi:hypothetical protein
MINIIRPAQISHSLRSHLQKARARIKNEILLIGNVLVLSTKGQFKHLHISNSQLLSHSGKPQPGIAKIQGEE